MNDVIVISHPRSGLTWLRRMCHEAAKEMGDDGWLFHFSHDGMGLERTTNLRLSHRLQQPSIASIYPRSQSRTFVFLYRDPRDVLWSNWHQLGDGESFSSFLRSPTHGIVPYVEWLLWWDNHRKEVDFNFMRYESIRVEPELQLLWMLKHALGVPREVYDLSSRFVDACTIENMRREENRNGGFFEDVRPVRGRIVREGSSRYWERYWSVGDVELCNSLLRLLKGTFAEVEVRGA